MISAVVVTLGGSCGYRVGSPNECFFVGCKRLGIATSTVIPMAFPTEGDNGKVVDFNTPKRGAVM